MLMSAPHVHHNTKRKERQFYQNYRSFVAEKEGFEPSIPFWGIHDFQSCALGQLRDFSMEKLCCKLAYNTLCDGICQVLLLAFFEFLFGQWTLKRHCGVRQIK